MASRPLHTMPTTLADVQHINTCLGTFVGSPQPGACMVRGTWAKLPWVLGLRAVPYGLPAAPHNVNHPGGRATYRYMPGIGLMVAHSRVHAW